MKLNQYLPFVAQHTKQNVWNTPIHQSRLTLEYAPDAGTGREDFDVRMLGCGRPFVLEIINPRAACPDQQDMTAMQHQLDKVGAIVWVFDVVIVLALTRALRTIFAQLLNIVKTFVTTLQDKPYKRINAVSR